MIALEGRYAAEVWYGSRQAAEIWLGNRLVWSGKRVPLRVLVDLGLISAAQLNAAAGAFGVSESEILLSAGAFASGQTGQKSAAAKRLDNWQADGSRALSGILQADSEAEILPLAVPEQSAGRKAEKAAKLEENAAIAKSGAGFAGSLAKQLEKISAGAQDASGAKAESRKRLEENAALLLESFGKKTGQAVRLDESVTGGVFGAGHSAKKSAQLDIWQAQEQAGSGRRAEVQKALWVLYGAGAAGHEAAAKKAAQLSGILASVRSGQEKLLQKAAPLMALGAAAKNGGRHLLQKAAGLMSFQAQAGHGSGKKAGQAVQLEEISAKAAHGTARRNRIGAVLDTNSGFLAGAAGVRTTAAWMAEQTAAAAQRSGGILAKVQHEGLHLAGALKFKAETQVQAAAGIFARAQAGMHGVPGRALYIKHEAGMRAQVLVRKSGKIGLYAQERIMPWALAELGKLTGKRAQKAARVDSAQAVVQSVPGSRARGNAQPALALAGLERAEPGAMHGALRAEKAEPHLAADGAKAGAAKGRLLRAVCVLGVEHRNWEAPIVQEGWLLAAQSKSSSVQDGWLMLDKEPESGWELPTRQDGWLCISQAKSAEQQDSWLVLDKVPDVLYEAPGVQDGWLTALQVQKAETKDGYLNLG